MSATGYDYEFGEWGGGEEVPEEQEAEQRYGAVSPDSAAGASEGEDEISYVYDYAEIELAEKRKRVESLRSTNDNLTRRRKTVMNMITKLVGKGVIADMSTLEGTAEEIQPIYEEQLMKFKDIKEKAIEDYRKLLGEVKVKAEYCESVRKKCAEIAGEQYDLELKTGVGMIHSKTQRELTHDDVVKMLNSSELLNHKLSLRCLKYKSVKRELKDLNDILENMASASINYVEIVEIPKRNILIEQLLDDIYNKISADRDIIKLHLEKKDDISSLKVQLQELKENKEFELKRLQEEWRSRALAKSRRQKLLKRLEEEARTPDNTFASAPRMRRFYLDCVERARRNEERAGQLRRALAEARAAAGQLTSAIDSRDAGLSVTAAV